MAIAGNIFRNLLVDEAVGDGGYYFGEKVAPEDADLVIVSAPWSVTSDFGHGATYTPDAIIDASAKSNLYDVESGFSAEERVATAEIDYNIQELSEHLGRDAERIANRKGENGAFVAEYATRKVKNINEGFAEMHESIYEQTKRWVSAGKTVAVVGGDHAVSFGAVKAVAEHHGEIGVLFVDAHADFACGDGVFQYTHRTIARNIVEEIPSVSRLVEVGVRDIDKSELEMLRANDRVELFLAEKVAAKRFEGESWGALCREMVDKLPEKVYISLDIDALKIEFCTHTNSPVPGGMTFDEVVYLVNCVVKSGRQIVGFDITEVVSNIDNKMDAIVAVRLLTKMIVATLNRM